MTGRVRAYLGMSLDGRIAGADDELDWLDAAPGRRVTSPVPRGPDEPLTHEAFLADVGALLLGRRTLDVLVAMALPSWPYGDLPVLVATNRPLAPPAPTVRPVAGTVAELVAAAHAAADGRDVNVDGGVLVRAVLAAGLLDELTVTVLPTVRGSGVGLFDGQDPPVDLDLVRLATFDDRLVQLTYVPHRR